MGMTDWQKDIVRMMQDDVKDMEQMWIFLGHAKAAGDRTAQDAIKQRIKQRLNWFDDDRRMISGLRDAEGGQLWSCVESDLCDRAEKVRYGVDHWQM